MCGGLCVSYLGNPESVGVLSSLAARMCSIGCCTSVCVGGCVFPAFVIQNLWVCTVASLQECAARNELHRLLHQCMCGWRCVSCLRNSESMGVLSSLAGRNVQRRLLQQCMCGCPCVSCLANPKSVGVRNSLPARMCSKK